MNWSDYPNFTKAEFDCKHTGRNDMQPAFMQKLQAMRAEYGAPMTITSGYRDPSHPVEAAKGHKKGEHTRGLCADIACNNGQDRFDLVRLALKHGFHRIGIAKTFVHIGLGDTDLPPDVIWLYS